MRKPSLQSIQDQIRKLQAKAEALKSKNKKPALASIVKIMRENDIALEEIENALQKKGRQGTTVRAVAAKSAGRADGKERKPVAIKYKNPETSETWTGRGKTPRWIVDAEAAGRDRKQFAV